MNRASFLKSIGLGIAAAVITPKILIEARDINGAKDATYSKEWAKKLYAMSLKDRELGVEDIRIWDNVTDRNNNLYIVTAIDFDSIELTAMSADTTPNFMDVQKNVFADYFLRVELTTGFDQLKLPEYE